MSSSCRLPSLLARRARRRRSRLLLHRRAHRLPVRRAVPRRLPVPGRLCVADVRPVAALRPLGTVEAFALVQLDGTESRDPDGDDGVVEHVWSVRAVDARCAAPEVAGGAPLALVRFGCPGRYEVSLVVRDRLGVESAPATGQVDVLPAAGEPVVVAGPDVATDHACAGTPLVCRAVDPVLLSASADAGLALRWSVEPPLDRPLAGGDAPRPVRARSGRAGAARRHRDRRGRDLRRLDLPGRGARRVRGRRRGVHAGERPQPRARRDRDRGRAVPARLRRGPLGVHVVGRGRPGPRSIPTAIRSRSRRSCATSATARRRRSTASSRRARCASRSRSPTRRPGTRSTCAAAAELSRRIESSRAT